MLGGLASMALLGAYELQNAHYATSELDLGYFDPKASYPRERHVPAKKLAKRRAKAKAARKARKRS